MGDKRFYIPLTSNPIRSLTLDLQNILLEAKDANLISTQEFDFLFRPDSRMATFYLLPKVHKDMSNPPGRPVISGNETLTEPISKYVDFFIKPLLPTLPAFIQDTTDVLCKIEEDNFIGSDSLLVTMDVEALYTNIDHTQGLEAMSHFLNQRPQPQSPPTDFLVQLTEWTLNNNVFLFQDKVYKQVKGCAMGACFSPSYAGLFMGKWEEDFVFNERNEFKNKILWWTRFIDDVLLWWNGTKEELLLFHSYLNSANPNVKLSLEFDSHKIHFLDLEIYKDEHGYLHTTIFRKESHKNTILHAKSFHSPTLVKNIPFGQFQRLRRICNNDQEFSVKSKEMYGRFKERGYPQKTLDLSLSRATSLERQSLLKRKPMVTNKERVYFSTCYSTQADGIRRIIKRNWHLFECDDLLSDVFQDPPVFSFKRAPTLGDKLVHSHLPARPQNTWLPKIPNGTFKCGHCSICDVVTKVKTFTHPVTQQTYTTKHFINCKTEYVVYILKCSQCVAFYVGRTKRRLQDRLAEHIVQS